MKKILRDLAGLLPAPLSVSLQDSYRYVRYGQIRRRRKAQATILGRLKTPGAIAQGPFREMKYLSWAFCSEILPKLVGTYERELYPAIEVICAAGCDRIVDIGAAEGYYAVGLAQRNPKASIVAFELDASARYFLRKLARLNEVDDRIDLRGICEVESLAQALEGSRRPAVVCDCEGAEDLLLRPDRIETLRNAFILVETHDGLVTETGTLAGITDRLHERFGPTHEIEVIASTRRDPDQLPAGIDLSPDQAIEAMDEGRPWAQWMFLTPRN